MNLVKVKIAIIGQGYVGLPLAIEFGKKYPTIGFDINANRIEDLKNGIDHTNEAAKEQLKSADQLNFSSDLNDINNCNVFIVTVPTPIDEYKTPNLKPLKKRNKNAWWDTKKRRYSNLREYRISLDVQRKFVYLF